MRVTDFCLIAALVAPASALAATPDAGVREAAARAQRAIVKLQQEKASIEKDKAELAAKLESANREIVARRADANRARLHVQELEKSLLSAGQERDELKRRVASLESQAAQITQQCVRDKRELEDSGGRMREARDATAARLQAERQLGQACLDTNRKLQSLTRGFLKSIEQDVARAGLAPLGLRAVELENRLQQLADQVEDLRSGP